MSENEDRAAHDADVSADALPEHAAEPAEHAAKPAENEAEPADHDAESSEHAERAAGAEDGLLGRIELIESQPLAQRAAGFEQVHDELLAELQRSDHGAA